MELMVAVAIVGILSAIALPSYQNYVVRTHRSVAKAALNEMAARQEAFLADRKTYAAALNTLGYPAATTHVLTDKSFSATSTDAVYAVSVSAGATATTYTITAVPEGSQTRDTDCGTLSITQTGVKSASGPKGAECWRR